MVFGAEDVMGLPGRLKFGCSDGEGVGKECCKIWG